MLRHRFNWKRLSMAAALAYAHDRSDARIIFQTRPGAYNDELGFPLIVEGSVMQLGRSR